MENATIYHQVKVLLMHSKWIRILPIESVQVTNTRKKEPQGYVGKDDYLQQPESKFNIDSYCYFKYSNFHFVFNLAILIVIAAVGCFGHAFLYNLTMDSIEKIGFLVNLLTMLILPLTIFYFCNRNTPQVNPFCNSLRCKKISFSFNL